jgi:hypothetical protein
MLEKENESQPGREEGCTRKLSKKNTREIYKGEENGIWQVSTQRRRKGPNLYCFFPGFQV